MKNNTLTQKAKEAFALVGSMGGRANVRKNGKEYMKKIGLKGAKARWGKKMNQKVKN